MSTKELRLALLHELASRLDDVGKIQLQKLVYFLQEAKSVPTKYPYRMHHYGPYAEAIETDMARLRFAGYINIKPDEQGYGFHISPADDPGEEWKDLLKPYEEAIESVVRAFRYRPSFELELAATIHYMNELRPNWSTERLLETVRALKPKFDAEKVADAHSELKHLGLLS